MIGIFSKIFQKWPLFFQKWPGFFQNGYSLVKKNLKKRSVQVVLAFVLFGAIATTVFFGRKPVILVSDGPFNILYGEQRARYARLSLSIRIFRQIKTVTVADGAGPDLVAQAAASLSQKPYGVFFPYRYREGARRYLKDRPGSPVVILGGRNRPENKGEPDAADPWWFCTDTLGDLYRAGFLAGEFALQDPESGGAALYQDGLGETERTAFSRGLSEQGWEGTPFFSSNAESASRFLKEKNACLVLLKKGDARFFEDSGAIVLFTWVDPALTPQKTTAVFDDSPWAQLGLALKSLKKEKIPPGVAGLSLIPSELTVLRQKYGKKKGTFGINRIKSLKYMERNTDNKNSV